MSENLERNIIESLNFTGSIYRILLSQKTVLLAKISLIKQLNLLILSLTNTIKENRLANSTQFFSSFLDVSLFFI